MRTWGVAAGAALILAGLVTSAWVVGVSQAPVQAPAEAPDLAREAESLKAVCARCHNLQIVTDTHKSYDAWHDTVQKMVDRGAKGTDDQYDDIMDYLHRTVTTIDVNSADTDELEIVLHVSETTAQAIVARRATRKFAGTADLRTIPGVDAATVDAKAKLIFFN